MPEAMLGAMLDGCSEQSTQRTQQTQRTQRCQDQGRKGCVSDAPKPVDNDDLVVSHADLLRIRVTLAGLQARQDRIRDSLNRSGLTSIADRLDFLIAQRSADEVLAWNRHWTSLGVVRPAPQPEVFARPVSLSVPSSYKPKRRKRSVPVIAPDRQLEIALAVLAAKETAADGAEELNRKEAA